MRHAEAYTVLFDGFVRRLCATASRDDSLPLLALHRRRWRSGASDLLVHAARDGAARGRLRAFAGGLLGRAEGAGAVGPPAELDADAALNLGPRRGHEKEQRRDREDGGDAVEGRAFHRTDPVDTRAKLDVVGGMSTLESVARRVTASAVATVLYRAQQGSTRPGIPQGIRLAASRQSTHTLETPSTFTRAGPRILGRHSCVSLGEQRDAQ